MYNSIIIIYINDLICNIFIICNIESKKVLKYIFNVIRQMLFIKYNYDICLNI